MKNNQLHSMIKSSTIYQQSLSIKRAPITDFPMSNKWVLWRRLADGLFFGSCLLFPSFIQLNYSIWVNNKQELANNKWITSARARPHSHIVIFCSYNTIHVDVKKDLSNSIIKSIWSGRNLVIKLGDTHYQKLIEIKKSCCFAIFIDCYLLW